MNLIQAKRINDEYSFLKGKTIRKINETDYFPIDKYILAPTQLSEFTANFDFYMDSKPPFNGYSNTGSYQIYLMNKYKGLDMKLSLEDAIKDYEIDMTYTSYLEYLASLHNKYEAAYNNKQLELAAESNPSGFVQSNALEVLAPYKHNVLVALNEYNKIKTYIANNIDVPDSALFTTRLVELHK